MIQVDNDQSVVVSFRARKADTVPTSARGYIRMVHTDIDLAIVVLDKTASLSGPLINVVDVSLGRVVCLPHS